MDQIISFFANFFSTEGFPPRWVCGSWTEFHGWLYIIANLGIWSAYMSIPFLLIVFVQKRKDLPFPKIFGLFALFIFACGTTHLVDASMFWWPAYRFAAVVLLFTALVSWWTIFAIVGVLPQALSLRGPAELEKEIKVRTAALQESENRLRILADIVESSEDAIYRKDQNGILQSWNHAAEKLYGYTPEEVLGKHIDILFPEGHKNEWREVLDTIRKTGEGISGYETVRVAKDGRRLEIALTLSPVYDADGVLVGASAIARDISERKAAEKALIESEAKFRRLSDANLMAIAFWEMSGLIYDANDAFLKMFGLTRQDLEEGKINWRHLTAPDSLQQHEEGLARASRGEMVEPYEAPYIHRDGHTINALVGYTLLEGHKDKGVVFLLDITNEVMYEKSREMFLATLTHDLKTPLFGNEKILGLLKEERFGPLTDDQQSIIQELITSNRFMFRLVDNMLSTHLYEKGLPDLHFEPEDINDLINQNRDLYTTMAVDKKQHIDFRLAENLPKISVDAFEIQRVINNLLDNAITFTPVGGEIVVSTRMDGDQIEFAVQDTGPGMTDLERKEAFNHYKRYQKKLKHVGVGLGLYLSRLVVEAHGGTISVDSTPGEGSRFYIRFRLIQN